LADFSAAYLILGETDSEAVRKVTEGRVALLFGFRRREKSFEIGGLRCLLFRLGKFRFLLLKVPLLVSDLELILS
jgi:hypothetical protein